MTIENCNFRNINNTAIKITEANPSISECNIQNNSYGIYLYQSNPTLSNNTITNSTNEGIYMTSSSPVLTNNSIYNNGGGIFTYGGSLQFGTGMGSDGNNVIIDNSGIGIYSVSSNVNMGSCVGCHSNGGKNSVYNNTSNLWYLS